MKKSMMLLMLAAAFSAQVVMAQTTSTPDTATLNFVTQASLGGMKEIESGKLAVKNAESKDVKKFGAWMIKDHTKANAQLMTIVKSKGYNIPPPSSADAAPDAMLASATGSQFDKNYVTMMVSDHKKTIALFQYAAANAPDPQIKAFAAQKLPVLNQHLQAVQALATKIGASDGSK